MFEPAAKIPANFSMANVGGTGATVDVVTAAANARGLLLHTAALYQASTAAAADRVELLFNGRAILGRLHGPSAYAALAYPLLLPPGIALRFFGTDADAACDLIYSLL